MAVLAALGIAACGDDEESTVDPADFEACVEEETDFRLEPYSDEAPDNLKATPEKSFSIIGPVEGSDLSSFAVVAYVFDDGEKAATAAEAVDNGDTIRAESESNVTWVYGDFGEGLDENLESAFKSCAGS